jgi:uncharacterized membrane protein SpoIIM required for sporulation
LAALVDRAAAAGIRSLSAAEIDEMVLAYRAATSDLAIAQTRGEDGALVAYLNRLTARAHAIVYVATAHSGWTRTVAFVTRDFPREVRRSWAPIVLCAVVTIVSALVAYGAVLHDPSNVHALLGSSEPPAIRKSLHDANFGFDRAYSLATATLVIANNVKVAALAFAGGMTGGLVTGWVILENGLMVGGYGALFARAGFGADFWATIAPHGVIELSAIQIAGGAGLVLAGGYLRPGRARRVDALVIAARRAGTLILGVALLLCVAGTIEGFVSPQRLPIPDRVAIGAVTAVALAAYLLGAGSTKARAS